MGVTGRTQIREYPSRVTKGRVVEFAKREGGRLINLPLRKVAQGDVIG